MTFRKVLGLLCVLAAVVLSFMPLLTGEREIAVRSHHLDHALLMLLGAIAGLALYTRGDERESAPWLWIAVLCPILATVLMAPSLYALVDAVPWLHTVNHLVFVLLAMLTAYGGQRYVRGVGWATGAMLETMAIVAAFGYGVAPAAATVVAPASATIPATADAAHGKQIFAQNCAVCHGQHGEGGEGPPLRNERSRKDFTQLQAWIKKPAPPMPTLYPSPLTASDVADVAAYVESLR
jgi:mono/diheme cytochrome c family protein